MLVVAREHAAWWALRGNRTNSLPYCVFAVREMAIYCTVVRDGQMLVHALLEKYFILAVKALDKARTFLIVNNSYNSSHSSFILCEGKAQNIFCSFLYRSLLNSFFGKLFPALLSNFSVFQSKLSCYKSDCRIYCDCNSQKMFTSMFHFAKLLRNVCLSLLLIV